MTYFLLQKTKGRISAAFFWHNESMSLYSTSEFPAEKKADQKHHKFYKNSQYV